jgi:ribosomal protein S27AE
MRLRWLSERTRSLVMDPLLPEPEVERVLVAGAVVVREGEHFRIESGDDSWSELEARARRLEGLCDCGAVLSAHGQRAHCRSCGRDYSR